MGTHDHTGTWLQFLHWDQKMNEQQEKARALMEKIRLAIIQENEQVSSRLIDNRIIYNLLQSALYYDNNDSDFVSQATTETKTLITYKALRNIKIPLVYLVAKKPTH